LRVRDDDFDLSAFNGTVEGIEVVNMNGREPSATVLTASDVLDLSDTDALTILGDSDDRLEAGGGWNDGGTDSGGLQVFTQDLGGTLATLLVDPDVPSTPTSSPERSGERDLTPSPAGRSHRRGTRASITRVMAAASSSGKLLGRDLRRADDAKAHRFRDRLAHRRAAGRHRRSKRSRHRPQSCSSTASKACATPRVAALLRQSVT
jgi:hypothetical protein